MIRARFLAPRISLPTIETQAIRLHEAIRAFQSDRIESEITLLPLALTPENLGAEMAEWITGTDILIVVKHQLFENFDDISPALMRTAHEYGTVVVSHPCDGVEKGGSSGISAFTAAQADAVLTLSTAQYQELGKTRVAGDLYHLGHASRLEGNVGRRMARDRVHKVVWENPVHYNPAEAHDPERLKPHRELEDLLKTVCEREGARLSIVRAWYPPQPYENWLETMRTADIAIECKALNKAHTPAQIQKPAVKVLNYLSLGLPVICDSLPAYRELGTADQHMLFADTMEEWERQLTRLIGDRGLRYRLSRAGYETARSHRIENVCENLAAILETLMEKHGGRKTTQI